MACLVQDNKGLRPGGLERRSCRPGNGRPKAARNRKKLGQNATDKWHTCAVCAAKEPCPGMNRNSHGVTAAETRKGSGNWERQNVAKPANHIPNECRERQTKGRGASIPCAVLSASATPAAAATAAATAPAVVLVPAASSAGVAGPHAPLLGWLLVALLPRRARPLVPAVLVALDEERGDRSGVTPTLDKLAEVWDRRERRVAYREVPLRLEQRVVVTCARDTFAPSRFMFFKTEAGEDLG